MCWAKLSLFRRKKTTDHENGSQTILRSLTANVSHIPARVLSELPDQPSRKTRRTICFCAIEPNQKDRQSLYIDGYAQTIVNSIEGAVLPLEALLSNIREKTQKAVTDVMSRNETTTKNKLTINEKAAIYLYTMAWEDNQISLYSLLNQTLRAARNIEQMQPWFGYLKFFFMALIKLPSIEETVWRGVRLDLSNDYTGGQEIVWWSVSSCTESIDILQSDHFLGQDGPRTLFSIECYRGKLITPFSAYPAENEILLLPGTKLQVVSKMALARDLHIIHLKEILLTDSYLEMPMTNQELKYERAKNGRKVNAYLQRLIFQSQGG